MRRFPPQRQRMVGRQTTIIATGVPLIWFDRTINPTCNPAKSGQSVLCISKVNPKVMQRECLTGKIASKDLRTQAGRLL